MKILSLAKHENLTTGKKLFLTSANLICRGTDISEYFRESLGIRDNENRLYSLSTPHIILQFGIALEAFYERSWTVVNLFPWTA